MIRGTYKVQVKFDISRGDLARVDNKLKSLDRKAKRINMDFGADLSALTRAERQIERVRRKAASVVVNPTVGGAGSFVAGGVRGGGRNIGGGFDFKGAAGVAGAYITFDKLKDAIIGGVVAAANLESAMIGVAKTTGLAKTETDELKSNLLDFSTTAPVAIDSLLETAKVAGQLGIQGAADIENFTKTFAKLEVASDRTISGEFGATAFAKFLDQSGAGVERAEQIASSFVHLGNTSKLTEGKLLSMAQELGKLSASFNVSAESTLGISAAFTEMAITPEIARSTFLRFFSAVKNAVSDGDGLKQFNELTGLTRKELEELQKTNPEEILIRFSKGLQQAKAEGRNLSGTFKDMKLNGLQIEPVWAALSVSGDKLEEKITAATEAARLNNLATGEMNALNKEFQTASQGFNSELVKMQNSLTSLSDAIFSGNILTWLTDLVKALNAATNGLAGFIKEMNNASSIGDVTEAVLAGASRNKEEESAVRKFMSNPSRYLFESKEDRANRLFVGAPTREQAVVGAPTREQSVVINQKFDGADRQTVKQASKDGVFQAIAADAHGA